MPLTYLLEVINTIIFLIETTKGNNVSIKFLCIHDTKIQIACKRSCANSLSKTFFIANKMIYSTQIVEKNFLFISFFIPRKNESHAGSVARTFLCKVRFSLVLLHFFSICAELALTNKF